MASELERALIVEFPLRGEHWVAETSPADRLPSHGTDQLGMRYSYDFIKVDARPGLRISPAGALRGLLVGARTRDCYAWGAPVHAPLDGEVVQVVDGVPERDWVQPARELFLRVRNAATFTPARLPFILGNHVIIRSGDISSGHVHAAFVHLVPGSVAVTEGQRIAAGEVIGRVGHTGNSTSPHLHFQLMDSADPLRAKGIPCAFRSYDVLRDGVWTPVENGIPRRSERIRYAP
jgi:murein DD-endopeptidase MepM/ murein hydrolase activator NlpD